MPIVLALDTAGGANAEGHTLRNVAGLSIGQVALPDTGNALQVTGRIKVSDGVDTPTGMTYVERTAGVERRRVSATGVHGFGTGVSTGASVNDIVIPNASTLRGVNVAGTNTLPLVSIGGSNRTTIHGNANIVDLLDWATTGSAGALAGYIQITVAGINARIPYHFA